MNKEGKYSWFVETKFSIIRINDKSLEYCNFQH